MKLTVYLLAIVGCLVVGCGDSEDTDSGENTGPLCGDGDDNDDDGDVDCDDEDCAAFCSDTESETEPEEVDPDERHLLLRDEGNSVLHYVSLADESENWHVDIPQGRDIQLVGDGRVLIGTTRGYEEYDIATGEKVAELTGYAETIAAQRLRNGNTLLVKTDWQGSDGIALLEVNADGEVVHTIEYSDYDYARLARQTPAGTYLVTSDTHILELNDAGELVWEATVQDSDQPHAWMALRLANGTTVASCGYARSLQIFNEDGEMIQKIAGGSIKARPTFYSGLQILRNGNYVISNWQDHGPDNGNLGHQLVEYNPDGELVWTWEQDPTYISSIQAHIVLDGLDIDKLHVENEDGVLAPVD